MIFTTWGAAIEPSGKRGIERRVFATIFWRHLGKSVQALPGIAALVIFLMALLFLFTPVSLEFDTAKKSLHAGWMGVDLKIRLDRRKPARSKAEPERKKKSHAKAIGLYLFEESDLIFELLRKARRPLMRLLQSVSIRNIEASLSTPDPLWNGVLYGICFNFPLENVHLSANFNDINYVKGELQLYPYKIVETAVPLLIGLPYRRIIRVFLSIRKSSAG